MFDRTLLRVPDYQRGYAWELEHLTEFWEDLMVLPLHANHYTGTVVLHAMSDGHVIRDDAGLRRRTMDIVDGQQRLTTIILLLNELRRHLEAVGASREAQNVTEHYVWMRRDAREESVLTLGGDVQAFWERSVLADQPDLEEARLRSQARLLEARKFFENELGKLAARRDATDVLRELLDTVTDRLRFTVYEVDDAAQVGVIFETLNDRGKPLTELEKAKNYLLYLASGLEPGPRASLSEEINTAWARVYERLMAADIIDPGEEDSFLRAHWLMAVSPVRSRWSGTASLKEHFPRQRYWSDHDALVEDVRSYVRELADAARAFGDTRRPLADGAFADMATARDEVRDWSERLRRVGALVTFTPLLMALRLRHRGSAELYREAVELCERFSFRVYRVGGVRTNAGQERFFNIAHDVYHGRESPDGCIARMRSAIAAWSPGPSFKREWEARGEERNWYTWGGARYFLYELERDLTGSRAEKLHWSEVEQRPLTETIEHILPQTPRGGEWPAFNDAARQRHTHDLGNLVLTFDNSSYSNKAYAEKRAGPPGQHEVACYLHSPLLQEQRVARYEDWTPATVDARRDELVVWALQRWAVEGDLPPDPADADDAEDVVEDVEV